MPHAAASRCAVWVPSRPIQGRPPRSCTRWTARALCLIASERTARSRGSGPHDSWPHARHPSKASGDAPSLRLARERRSPCGFSTPPCTKSIHSACRASPACITAASEDSLERRAPATWPTSTCARRLRRLLSRRQAPRARGERAEKDYLPMRPFTMVREILPRALSTPVIHTVTVSPTATTSLGCFTKRSASLEMWTRPS